MLKILLARFRFSEVFLLLTLLCTLLAKLYAERYNPGRRLTSPKEDRSKSSGEEGRKKKRASAATPVVFAGRRVTPPCKIFIEATMGARILSSEEEAALAFPRKYERHGHVVVTRLNEGCTSEAFKELAPYFAQSFLPVKITCVIMDTEGIAGELRKPIHQIVWTSSQDIVSRKLPKSVIDKLEVGDSNIKKFEEMIVSPSFTTHIENGVKYSFDVMKVMFCSGNTTERMHFGTEINAKNEVVVDMFAGIGYFTLPLAMNGNIARLHALEKNPDSARYLQYNALQNGVGGKVTVYCGDNREVTGTDLCGKCHRVLMGYIPSCKEFIPRAVSFLRTSSSNGAPKGVIHYHYLSDKGAVAYKTAHADFVEMLGEEIVQFMEIVTLRNVKSYAPKKYHYVADVVFSGKRLQ